MKKRVITTTQAPSAIGTYSQAIQVEKVVYLSGQIPLNPHTMTLISDDIGEQIHQVFLNLQAVCEAAQGTLNDIVKLTIYLTNLSHFPLINETMARFFTAPYPARTTIEVSALPKGAQVEVEAVLILG